MESINKTKQNSRMTLVLALSYSSRWEIARAARIIAGQVADHKLKSEEVSQELFQSYLTTKDIPEPSLLIRTSGEFRISNFLLWQIAYSELYFTPKLWPDFRKDDLYEAILDYQNRERRFGMISEQLF
jgi:undecaprenyl diphosphate synthase